MDRNETEIVVLKVLSTILKSEVDVTSSRHNTARWDSLKHIEIIFAVEDELGVEFSEEELASIDSVVKIVDQAMTKHAP